MKQPSDSLPGTSSLRERLLDAGVETMRKSYYPSLQAQLRHLREKERYLQEKSQALERMVEELERAKREIAALNQDLEQRVNLRTKELELANQELEAFTSMASHDLRAPLRHVLSFAELLQRSSADVLKEPAKTYLCQIHERVLHMQSLLGDLLAFSKAGRAELHRAPVDLGKLINDILGELQVDTAQRQIAWEVEQLPIVQGDRNLLHQVLFNLVSNALKYTRSKTETRIHIGSQDRGFAHIILVRDNGVGFDPLQVDKLFQPFHRLHSEEEFPGTGMGLAIVARIISRHGGRVWAEAKLGEGAAFYFTLPKS